MMFDLSSDLRLLNVFFVPKVKVLFGCECKPFKQKYGMAMVLKHSDDCCTFEVSLFERRVPKAIFV